MAAPVFTYSIGNKGYCMFGAETNPGTPITPTVPAYMDNETMQTDFKPETQTPIAGSYMDTHQVLPGLRTHGGDLTIVAEPNTAVYPFEMLLHRGSKTGSNPYTWPYTLDLSGSCTIDIHVGNGYVKRFFGCMSDGVAPSWSNNQLMLKSTISATGSFLGAMIASTPTGSGPYTVVLDTNYTPTPTLGLVIGDTIRFYTANNSLVDATVASITNSTTFTTTTDVTSFGSGDFVFLRSATASYNVLSPFLWSNTDFCFGDTAADALSATPTALEQGSTWNLSWPFESKDGAHLSGSADPAMLRRLTAQPTFDAKVWWGNPASVLAAQQLSKSACVIRHYAHSGDNTYELRLTLNHIKTTTPLPSIGSKKVNFSNIKYILQEDDGDGQAFDIEVINAVSSIA